MYAAVSQGHKLAWLTLHCRNKQKDNSFICKMMKECLAIRFQIKIAKLGSFQLKLCLGAITSNSVEWDTVHNSVEDARGVIAVVVLQ